MKFTLAHLSYASNAALLGLVVYLWRSAPPASSSVTETAKASAPAISSSPDSVTLSRNPAAERPSAPIDWRNTENVIGLLKKMGASPKILFDFASILLSEKYSAQMRAATSNEDLPRWQRHNGRPTADSRARLAEIRKAKDDELRSLLGADYDRAKAEIDALVAAERQGRGTDTSARLAEIQRDFAQTRATMQRQPFSPARLEAEKQLEAETDKAIRAALTPAEYDDYMTYESPKAREVQQRLSGLDLDDATYRKVLAVMSSLPGGAGSTRAAGASAHLAENQALRASFGDEIALHVSLKAVSNFKEFDDIYRGSNQPTAQRIEKLQSFIRFMAEVDTLQTSVTSRDTLYEKGAATADKTYRELVAGLTETSRAQFDRTTMAGFMKKFIAASKP